MTSPLPTGRDDDGAFYLESDITNKLGKTSIKDLPVGSINFASYCRSILEMRQSAADSKNKKKVARKAVLDTSSADLSNYEFLLW